MHERSSVRSARKPVAENVIGLQAADWPDPASSVLAQGRSDLHDAGSALRNAKATAAEICRSCSALRSCTSSLACRPRTLDCTRVAAAARADASDASA